MTVRFKKSYVDCAFGQLHVTRTETMASDSGTAVLLLNSRARSLLKLAEAIADRHHCVIVDIPGMGLSSPLPMNSSMTELAAGIISVADSLGLKKANVFGLHTGAKVAAAIAKHHSGRVNRLILAGKTHSIIPALEARNAAMAAHVARRPPDVAIVTSEGRYVDDTSQQASFESIFRANYSFDFTGALKGFSAPALIVEITTEFEDRLYGRQAAALADSIAQANVVYLEEKDSTGLDLYAGIEPLAKVVGHFFG